MNAITAPGLTSIIIPCFNGWRRANPCLQALIRHTQHPWELIVVNVGSNHQAKPYSAAMQGDGTSPLTLIVDATSRDIPSAINQALGVARGEYLVLLDENIVVTDGWLDQLIALTSAQIDSSLVNRDAANIAIEGLASADISPAEPLATNLCASARNSGQSDIIGLTGPMSNRAAPPQFVERVPYHDRANSSFRSALAR